MTETSQKLVALKPSHSAEYWEMRHALVTASRDASVARESALRAGIIEASDPDFLYGAMDNVNDMDVSLSDFAAAASRAIRAALEVKP